MWRKENLTQQSVGSSAVILKVAQSCLTLYDPMDYTVHGILQARIQEWVAFPFSRGSSQGSNPSLPHCRLILYQLSHKGSLRILEWVAVSFSRGPSQPRDQTQVSHIAGGLLTSWPQGKPKNTGVDSLSFLPGIFPTQE